MNAREQVAWILRDIRTLPTLPYAAVALLRQSESLDASMTDIAKLVEGDPSVATRLLKLVNTPFFGIRREIASVQQALLLVGLNNLRSLVLSTSVMDMFDQKGKVGDLERGDLWKHCVATAVVARTVAKATRTLDPEVAFTAGLIHDIGKLIIDRYLHDELVKIADHMQRVGSSMREAEQAILGVTHTEIGLHLAIHWNLPEVLRECVAYHHEPESATAFAAEAAVIATANAMTYELGHGYGPSRPPTERERMRSLAGLSEDEATKLRGRLAESITQDVSAVVDQSADNAR